MKIEIDGEGVEPVCEMVRTLAWVTFWCWLVYAVVVLSK